MAVRVNNGGTHNFYRSASVPSGPNLTLSGWVYVHSLPGAGATLFGGDNTSDRWCLCSFHSNDQVYFDWAGTNGGSFDLASGWTPSTGTWYYLAIVHDSSGNMRLFRCALGETTLTEANTLGTGGTNGTALSSIFVGTDGWDEPVAANIAFHRIWDGTALSKTQLEAELQSTTPVVTTNLWADYRFASGALTTDSSGNSRSLTATGSPSYVADPDLDGEYGAAGGTTYNHSLTLTASTALSGSSQMAMNASVSFAAASAMSHGSQMTMAQSLTLASAAATAISGGMALANSLTVAANAALTGAATKTLSESTTITASAQQTASAIATMLGLLQVTGNATLSAGGSMVMNALATYAANAAFTGSLGGSVYTESLSMAANAAATVGAQQAMNCPLTMTAEARQEAVSQAVMNALLTLTGDARLSGTLGTLISDSLTLMANASATAAAQQALATYLALQANADLAAVARMVAVNSLGLQAGSAMAATATMQMTALLSLAAAALMTASGTGAVTDYPNIIRMVGEAIKAATLYGESIKQGGMTGESVKGPSITGETIDS